MMPFDLSFRRLVRKYIPQLSHQELNRHESLVALRHQLIQEEHMQPPGIPAKLPPGVSARVLSPAIEAATRDANAILAPYKEQYEAVLRLWIARRNLAHKRGGMLQIPTTVDGLTGLVSAIVKHIGVEFSTWWVLTGNRLKYGFQNQRKEKGVFATVLIALLIWGLRSCDFQMPDKIPGTPKDGLELRDNQ